MNRRFTVTASMLLGAVMACSGLTTPGSTALDVDLEVQSSTLQVVDSTSLVLIVRNVSNRSLTYDVPAGNGAFDFAIERPDGAEVWRLSRQPRTTPAESLTIPRGGVVSFTHKLRAGGPTGVDLSPGVYKIRGWFIDSRRDEIATTKQVSDLSIVGSP